MRLAAALTPALDAFAYLVAPETSVDAAIPLEELRCYALTSNDCIYLVAAGLLEILPRKGATSGHNGSKLGAHLSAGAMARLTEAGIRWVSKWCSCAGASNREPSETAAWEESEESSCVNYDESSRELRLSGSVVVAVGSRAQNRERLLMAFQRANWASQIENPLTSRLNGSRAQQLRDTVHELNHAQNRTCGRLLIRFHANEKGRKASYEVTDEGRTLIRYHRKRGQ